MQLPIVVDVKLQGGGPRGRPTPYYFMDHNEKAEYKDMFANEVRARNGTRFKLQTTPSV